MSTTPGQMIPVTFPRIYSPFASMLQLLNRKIGVGKNTNFAGDAHGFLRQVLRGKLGVLGQRFRGGHSVRSAGANRANAVVWLDHVAVAGNQESGFGVSDNQ